jgi:ABC-type lipoprotein release transport system permease subunit
MIAGHWLQSLLFDTSRTDPVVLGSAGALMFAVALTATLLPARAAANANPASLLRS